MRQSKIMLDLCNEYGIDVETVRFIDINPMDIGFEVVSDGGKIETKWFEQKAYTEDTE